MLVGDKFWPFLEYSTSLYINGTPILCIMSYSFRNRPKLSDRYRGKSGDEILNELKNEIDEDRKMFFESSPGWDSVQSPGSFSRAGHPLDDMMSRGRQDIRSHLDDLAQRHPEFAEHLRCPPWGGEMGATSRGTWGRKRRGSGSSSDDISAQERMPQEAQPPEEQSPSRGRARQNNLPQYGLRNTVDLGQQQQQQCEDQEKSRGQRSWSAPPDNRTQNPPDPPRFVSRLDIPINATPNSSNTDQGKPPVAPKQPQPHHLQNQQPQPNINGKQGQGSNVRHIPIFVEGRDEPLLPKAADIPAEKFFTERISPQSTFNYGRPSQFTARQNQQPATHGPPQSNFNQNSTPCKTNTFVPEQPACQHSPSSQQKSTSVRQQEETRQNPTPQHAKRPIICDAISRVQAVQKDVDELKLNVDKYSGNSRKDKEYLYLDEMLTRCLVTLDNVETEGKDDVRQARKAVIRNIQQCISLLESKVPSPEESFQEINVEIKKPVKVCENASNPAGQDSVKLEDKTEASVQVIPNKEKVFQECNEPEMEVENLSPAEDMKTKCQTGDKDSMSELAMEAEQIEADKGYDMQVHLEPSNLEVTSELTSSCVTNLSPESAKQWFSDSVKSGDTQYKSGDSNLEKLKMQADENIKSEHLQGNVEVENLCSRDVPPDSTGSLCKNDKTTNLSPKDEKAILNKASKSKSKGSPKKGKCDS